MENRKVMQADSGGNADPGYGTCCQDYLPCCAGELSELRHAVDQRNFAEP
jgi:hypothetical protein